MSHPAASPNCPCGQPVHPDDGQLCYECILKDLADPTGEEPYPRCVFCDRYLGGPYQEDLFHLACFHKAEIEEDLLDIQDDALGG